MIAWTIGLAWASDPVLDAMQAELGRAVEDLSLEGADPPYTAFSRVMDRWTASVECSLGAVLSRSDEPSRHGRVLVRVGSPELDQTNFETWKDGAVSTSLVLGEDPVALRHDLWLAVDDAYKEALEGLAEKQAALQRRAGGDDVPSYVPATRQTWTGERPEPIHADLLEPIARELSAIFLEHPGVEFSRVSASATTGMRYVADTDGVAIGEPISTVIVRAIARVRADDGGTMADSVVFVASDPAGLPSAEVMRAGVEALATDLEAWRTLPELPEEYVGPVLFRGQAAPVLFHEVLVPALMGTPAKEKPPKGSRVFTMGNEEAPGPLSPRRRALPPGWTVVDDPTADPSSPAAYRYDSEGEPGRRVELVVDGVVREHLMSRTPSRAFPATNGHARAFDDGIYRGGAADLEVIPARPSSDRKLHKAALKAAASYGLDHYAVVDRLREPWLADWDGGAMFTAAAWFGLEGPKAPTPVTVRLVGADGTERVYRGASLGGLDRRSLKEVEAAGATRTAIFTSDPLQRVRAPDTVLAEIVVAVDPPDAEPPLAVPSPLVER
ncbi:MAG: hypothetical protein H6735_23270 [Alphaproteobacteria bacterium]|nr:hypothetical protein [Alphaproteobacteria bacterium]